MDEFNDNEIGKLLRLKRYEQPQPGYFENFLHEFHRRQRDELLREPLWRILLGRTQDFIFRFDVRSLTSYLAEDLSGTGDRQCRRSPERTGIIHSSECRRRMDACIPGDDADLEGATASQFE